MDVNYRDSENGGISAITGSIIEVKGLERLVRIHDLVKISRFNILGEVKQIYTYNIP